MCKVWLGVLIVERTEQVNSVINRLFYLHFILIDPFLQKRNLTRTVSANVVFEYILERFKSTYKYFAIPQLSYGPLFFHIRVKEVMIVEFGQYIMYSL